MDSCIHVLTLSFRKIVWSRVWFHDAINKHMGRTAWCLINDELCRRHQFLDAAVASRCFASKMIHHDLAWRKSISCAMASRRVGACCRQYLARQQLQQAAAISSALSPTSLWAGSSRPAPARNTDEMKWRHRLGAQNLSTLLTQICVFQVICWQHDAHIHPLANTS